MWRDIWRCLEEVGLGQEGAEFLKVAAHATKAKIAKAPAAEKRLLVANTKADAKAKQGGAEGTNGMLHFICQAVNERANVVVAALQLIAGVAAGALAKNEGWPDVMAPPKQPPAGEAKLLREVVRHAWLSRSFGHQCKRCGKVAVDGATMAAANQHHCKGSTSARMLLDELAPT